MTKIDSFYKLNDKSNYYLGMISQVNRSYSTIQIENLSLLTYRKLRTDIIAPNTINVYVLIDSSNGLFFGEIFQSKVPNSNSVHEMLTNGQKEKIFPEINIDILGYIPLGEKYFKLNGPNTVGITDKVYISNENAIEYFVKSIEHNPNSEGQLSTFADLAFRTQNYPLKLQPSTLFNRHLMTVGTTNSGKSTSALSILDKLLTDKIRTLIIDPTGEYSESFKENEVEKYVLGVDTFVSTSSLLMQHWESIFETNDGTQPAVLASAINSLRYQKKMNLDSDFKKIGEKVCEVSYKISSLSPNDKEFDIHLLAKQVSNEAIKIDSRKNVYIFNDFSFNSNQYLVQKIEYKLSNTSFLNFFNSNNQGILEIVKNWAIGDSNKSLYIDTSKIGVTDEIGGVVIDLIANHLINIDNNNINPFILFIDEIHRYTKNPSKEGNLFYTGLNSIAREGRKKGIFLFLTTQNPNDVDKILLGQIGTLVIHRLTSSNEIKSIQNHMAENQIDQIKKLNKGEAMITSINLLKDLYVKVRKCNRTHKNETPNLLRGS
ncbi:ATP-binding protein [Staphylococcus chromogenes]|uniref:ATP-binding protein n=1 Tax=Staphylococcus chromogenes TaxID=46126 RepID=UPI00290489AF|nr:ATP-binding protein [Staphylococcus chromogenes]MDU0451211.1 ATP-binding protein [Staphylococcus chromogenes]